MKDTIEEAVKEKLIEKLDQADYTISSIRGGNQVSLDNLKKCLVLVGDLLPEVISTLRALSDQKKEIVEMIRGMEVEDLMQVTRDEKKVEILPGVYGDGIEGALYYKPVNDKWRKQRDQLINTLDV